MSKVHVLLKSVINKSLFPYQSVAVVALLAVGMIAVGQTPLPRSTTSLPTRISDADYWKLVSDISEPDAYFRIVDNFTSNEDEIGGLFTQLRKTGVEGGVYLGVGPEQNLTYIAAI